MRIERFARNHVANPASAVGDAVWLIEERPNKGLAGSPSFLALEWRRPETDDLPALGKLSGSHDAAGSAIKKGNRPVGDERNALELKLDAVKQLLGKYPVILAYLYGSEARRESTTLSDIDIALVVKDRLAPEARLQMELALEVEFASIHHGDYDVRIINDAPLAVKAEVVQTGALLFAQADDVRVDFEASTRDAYFDFLPVLRFHREAYLDAQRDSLEQKGLL